MKNMYHIGISILIFVASSVTGIAFPGSLNENDPFQPSVTGEESRLLADVLKIAETNEEQAIDDLLAKIKKSSSPALDFTLGNLYWRTDNLPGAENAYSKALSKLPNFRMAIMNLGRIHLIQDKTSETISLYQGLVENGQANAETYLLLGHALFMEESVVSAESAYRQALLLRPRDNEARTGLVKALLQQERYQEGLALLNEILNAQPLDQDLWSLKVNGLLAKGNIEEAIAALEQARRLDCASPEMVATLGDLWLNQNRPKDGLAAYEEAFDQEDPDLERILRAAEGFLMLPDADGALKMLNQAEKEMPENVDLELKIRLLRLKSEWALLNNQFTEAETLSKTILVLDPLDGRTLLQLANIQVENGELAKAILSCERAARIDGFEANALLRQARIEIERDNYRQAVALLESAQVFEPRPYVADYLEQVRRLAK